MNIDSKISSKFGIVLAIVVHPFAPQIGCVAFMLAVFTSATRTDYIDCSVLRQPTTQTRHNHASTADPTPASPPSLLSASAGLTQIIVFQVSPFQALSMQAGVPPTLWFSQPPPWHQTVNSVEVPTPPPLFRYRFWYRILKDLAFIWDCIFEHILLFEYVVFQTFLPQAFQANF